MGAATTLTAQTVSTWNGGTGNWSNGSFWSAGVPNSASASVFVDGGKAVNSTVTVDGSYTVGALNISSGDAVNVNNGRTFTITDAGGFSGAGTLANNGAFTLGNSSGGSTMFFNGTTMLAGTGSLTLVNGDVVLSSGGGTLTIGSGQTVQGATGTSGGNSFGSGQLGIVNQGTINANVSGQTLLISPNSSGLTNNGLLEASGGATLALNSPANGGTYTNMGTIEATDQGTINVAAGILTNYSGTTLTGGTYIVLGPGQGASTLSLGGGSITTNAANVVLSGSVSFFTEINALTTNQGTFAVANGKAFTTAGALSNSGTLVAASGSTLTVNGNLTQSSTGTLTGNGGFTASILSIAGKIAPGGSISQINGAFTGGAGTLTLTGTTLLGSSTDLTFELGTVGTNTSDHLNVTGALTLDGRLDVSALTGFGVGRYDLIDYTGVLTNNVLDLGTLPAGYNYTIDNSMAGQVDLVVTNVVPEPSTWAGALMGLGFLVVVHRRRRAASLV